MATLPIAETPPVPGQTSGSCLPAQWFHQYFDVLWRLALRMGVPPSQVDDIVQDTFIAANRRRDDIAEGRERSFLMSTVVYLSSNYRRKAYVRNEVGSLETVDAALSGAPNAEQLLLLQDRRSQLQQLLFKLSENHRSVFVLYELEGFTVPEIAECLNLPIGTVSSRLARGRAHFSEAATAFQVQLAAEQEDP